MHCFLHVHVGCARLLLQPPPMEQQMAAAGQQRHKHGRKPVPQKVVTSIIDGLKQVYFHKVRTNSFLCW
jgi:hypothetical protein